ncbi:hypothetical protein HU719_009195 [Pseudomonas sp. SWRI107]|uniref:hypothetical protein n=1 Tax=Pseudomonas farsensis TaxID=2745492 RepID=UPI001C3E758A|nr:hypothetical protein [Pseudomonas farsensis]MBV4531583.1 hypothetical protein [Pseudomonas farsensis]
MTQYHDGTQRQQGFEHDAANPTRLTRVTCNKVGVDLASDVNGQLLSDHRKQAFKYHPGGRLRAVCDEKGKTLARYAYDGHQRLAAQYVASDQSTCELRYDGDALIGESWFDNSGAMVRQRSISTGIAEYEGAAVNWLIEDPQAGTAGLCGEHGVVLTPLLPFGEGTACDAISSGYDGMRRDPVTGSYHAGNGYRCYVPGLHRYSQPDWLSPFGEGA